MHVIGGRQINYHILNLGKSIVTVHGAPAKGTSRSKNIKGSSVYFSFIASRENLSGKNIQNAQIRLYQKNTFVFKFSDTLPLCMVGYQ